MALLKLDITQVIVEYGAGINAKNGQGQDPLFWMIEVSCSSRHRYLYLDIIRLLVGQWWDMARA